MIVSANSHAAAFVDELARDGGMRPSRAAAITGGMGGLVAGPRCTSNYSRPLRTHLMCSAQLATTTWPMPTSRGQRARTSRLEAVLGLAACSHGDQGTASPQDASWRSDRALHVRAHRPTQPRSSAGRGFGASPWILAASWPAIRPWYL